MRILVAEDDPKSLAFLAKGLAENGFTVDTAANGSAALASLEHTTYDLIVLDVMMPETDGWTVIATLRGRDDATPALFLTARDTVEDRVKGLELGADDYLVKPFAWPEFLARVRTLLRRSLPKSVQTLRVADLELDLERMKAVRGGQHIELTAKEFQVLTLLARHRGEVVSRATLAEQVWGMNFFVDSNAVDVAMGRLRRKVDDGHAGKLIHTVRGAGYLLEHRPHE